MVEYQEQITSANKACMDSSLDLATSAFNCAFQLNTLNIDTLRTFFEESMITAKSIVEIKDISELIKLQTSLAKSAGEKLVSYSQSVAEIISQSQEAISKIAQAKTSLISAGKSISSTAKTTRKAA